MSRLERISQIHAALAILTTLALVILLLRGLRAPLAQLLRGTAKLAQGDLAYLITIPGHDEFADLGNSFNHMAQDLQGQQRLSRTPTPISNSSSPSVLRSCVRRTYSRKVDETRRGFFADISHELRTPLTIIRGEGEISLRGANKRVAEYKRSIERIVEQAKHLSVLVNDLLFIARQGAGAARLNLQPIDLGNLVEKVCGDAR